MPLPVLPASNTPRFRFHYTQGVQHSFQMRSNASPAVQGEHAASFLTALGAAIYSMTMDFVDWAPAGSDVFNPVITGIEGDTFGAGLVTQAAQANAYNFIGRTSGGRRVRLMVFGATTVGGDYRFGAGEGASLDAALAQLIGSGNAVQGIDGLTPVWKSYVNALVSAHWQQALRP